MLTVTVFVFFAFMNGQPQEVDAYMTKHACEQSRAQLLAMLAEARQQSDKVPAGLSISTRCQEVQIKLEVKG